MQITPAISCGLVIWAIVSILRAIIGGWIKLARSYGISRSVRPRDGVVRKWRLQTAYMRWLTTYGNCLTFCADSNQLFISTGWLFRIGHAPLIIPWDEVTAVRGKGLLKHIVELRFKRAPSIPIRIGRILYERLEQNFSSR